MYKGKSFEVHLVLSRAILTRWLYTGLAPPLDVGTLTRAVSGLLGLKDKTRCRGTSDGGRGAGEEGKQRRGKKALDGGV